MSILILKGKYYTYKTDPDDERNVIGIKGKVGNIFTGIREPDGKKVIIKQVFKGYHHDGNISDETIFSVDHPRIVSSLETIAESSTMYIIREYIEGIDLKQLSIKLSGNRKKRLRFICQCMISALECLEYLHSRGIYHCDIKPSNLILNNYESNSRQIPSSPSITLIDLGRSFSHTLKQEAGNQFALLYSPPEVLLRFGNLINESTDIFSLGITMYELLTGSLPYDIDNPLKVMALQIVYPLPPHRCVPNELFTILQKACFKYPLKRPPHLFQRSELENFMIKGQESRYRTATDFRHELENFLAGY